MELTTITTKTDPYPVLFVFRRKIFIIFHVMLAPLDISPLFLSAVEIDTCISSPNLDHSPLHYCTSVHIIVYMPNANDCTNPNV